MQSGAIACLALARACSVGAIIMELSSRAGTGKPDNLSSCSSEAGWSALQKEAALSWQTIPSGELTGSRC